MGKISFEIICGTYEEFLLGYNFYPKSAELTQTFAAHDHTSSIRCVECCGHYVASGGADDRIIIYDFKTRKEHCMLTHHDGTINCIQFTDNHSHVMSGSADGILSMVRVGNWQVEKLWDKAHKGSAILDIAIHPSGKLALTLGADCSLRTWNLVKGRQAFIINLNSKSKDPRNLEKILWAEDGVRFVISGGKYTELWSIKTGGVLKQIEHSEKVTSCIWYDENSLIVGYENGNIGQVDIESEEIITSNGHQSRVKTLTKYDKWVVSGSSNGEIKVWKNMKEVCKQDTGCRITCLKIIAPIKVKEDKTNDENLLDNSILEIKDIPKNKEAKVEIVIEDDDDVVISLEKKIKKNFVKTELPEQSKFQNNFNKNVTISEHKKKKRKNKLSSKIKEETVGIPSNDNLTQQNKNMKGKKRKHSEMNGNKLKEEHLEDNIKAKIKKEECIVEESHGDFNNVELLSPNKITKKKMNRKKSKQKLVKEIKSETDSKINLKEIILPDNNLSKQSKKRKKLKNRNKIKQENNIEDNIKSEVKKEVDISRIKKEKKNKINRNKSKVLLDTIKSEPLNNDLSQQHKIKKEKTRNNSEFNGNIIKDYNNANTTIKAEIKKETEIESGSVVFNKVALLSPSKIKKEKMNWNKQVHNIKHEVINGINAQVNIKKEKNIKHFKNKKNVFE